MTIKSYSLLFSLILLLCGPHVNAEDKVPAPSLLPHTQVQMHYPGFWISRHANPDKVILSPEQIAQFNDHVQHQLNLTHDIFSSTENLRMEKLFDDLNKNITDYADKGFYTKNNVRDDRDFQENAKKNIQMTGIVSGSTPRYAIVTQLADQRFWPTSDPLLEKQNDIDFDQLQNSGLDVGTPVAVVHTSRDGQWVYAYGPISDGWVKVDHLAFASKDTIASFIHEDNFIVVTAPHADIYLDRAMTQLVTQARMGVRLPLVSLDDTQAIVRVPIKDPQGNAQFVDGYMARDAVHAGYMPLTARNLYTLSLKWLHTPYGWGDMQGGVDCSRLMAAVYATMGVILPRDSKNQAQVGVVIDDFADEMALKEKLTHVSNWQPGNLLTMKGHILMYLGSVDGVPYAIHATSGYREQADDKDHLRVLMKVVVSDLSLGEGSARGSLLKRLKKVVAVEVPDTH